MTRGIATPQRFDAVFPLIVQITPRTPATKTLTQEILATWLQVHLVGDEPCSKKELSSIKWSSWGAGIRLLSPSSVVPTRPLLNGFHATSLERGLSLVKQWITTCENSHADTCQFNSLTDLSFTIGLEAIQVIDVHDRTLRAFEPKLIKYASLSYVWGEAGEEHLKLFEALQNNDDGGELSTSLPSRVPGIIEEAMVVCKKLSISYLWVDLICIHQADPGKKSTEIKAMGYIYHLSHITIVVGSSCSNSAHLAPATSPIQEKHHLDSKQRIETI